MTTALESRLLPKIPSLAKKYGTLATFTLYLSETVDTDTSSVVKGAGTPYQRYTFPPTALAAEYAPDGSLVKKEGLRFFVPSGAATSDPLPFTPELGLRATVRGLEYRVDKIERQASGDQLAGYWLEARA